MRQQLEVSVAEIGLNLERTAAAAAMKEEAAGRRIAELVAELRALHGIVETGARDMEEAKDNLAELGALIGCFRGVNWLLLLLCYYDMWCCVLLCMCVLLAVLNILTQVSSSSLPPSPLPSLLLSLSRYTPPRHDCNKYEYASSTH